MGILSSLSELCFGDRQIGEAPVARRIVRRRPAGVSRRGRQCQIEALEPRELLAANSLVPQVLLGSVYFESDSGDDSLPNILQVSFQGGAQGTTLDKFTINCDKRQDGLTDGDLFFDTAAGGLGAFKYNGLSIVSATGFSVESVSVVDGGSQIVFNLKNFDAGDKLVFSIDVDEAQFVEVGAVTNGVVDPTKVDTNSLVEGGEFQRSIMTGDFSAPHYVALHLQGLFWDDFDPIFAAAQIATGETLDLPSDNYSPGQDYSDRTAGAIAYAPQIPLASISGWVYHDRSNDGVFNTPIEEGIGGVTLELLKDGVATGITTATSTNPGTLGYYEFLDLQPGNYGVRETQPAGWLDGKDTAGDHGGVAADESAGRVDRITGAILNYGDHGLNYNFGELLPGSIRGTVQAHDGGDCNFDQPQFLLSGVQIDLLDGTGKLLTTTQTNANGAYAFLNLAPGTYKVLEHQPANYYNDDERVGTAGGQSGEDGNEFSFITGIKLGSAVDAVHYDFCEQIGPSLSGWVYHDRNDDGNRDVGSEEGIGGVTVQLLDAAGNPTGLTTTTSTSPGQVGYYEFKNLAPGKYGVHEIQPAGWLDGKDKAGDHGGSAASEVAGIVDRITGAMLVFGDHAINYNFGELLPGSIAGQVQAHGAGDCNFDEPERTLEGVTIQLLNSSGTVIATTQTDADGRYHFDNLRPGQYGIHEVQPAGYFSDDTRIGSVGGNTDNADNFTLINLPSGVNAVHYDFCEQTPGSIAGQVQAHTTGDCNFDNPEIVLQGVTIQLFDGNGHLIATTTTDANGRYRFNNLPQGVYKVHELQPANYYSDDSHVGSVGGLSDDADTLSHLNLPGGTDAMHYDFCEHVGLMLSGNVYHDRSDDGIFDRAANPPEEGIGNVIIKLLKVNDAGQLVDTGLRATTDASGFYKFNNLAAGKYAVMEIQPAGWLDGKDTPGNLGGLADPSPPGDMISSIMINWGEMATEYNFGELLPGSIRGKVQSSPDGDCEDGIGETPIAGVQIDLLDREGGVIATTFTDRNGDYSFDGLRPGNYSVSEHQPAGYFQMDAHVGDGTGVVLTADLIGDISIASDQHLVDYDFCETPPSSIAGQVQAHTNGECDFDHPQQVIAGVTIELRDGQGNVLATTTTDANGRYHFDGLPAGEYTVHELQPAGYISDDDRVGTAGGQADDPDTISHIELPAGLDAIQYDFCERVPPPISPPPPPPFLPPPPPPVPPPLIVGPQLAFVPPPFFLIAGPWIPQPGLYAGSVGGASYTWHLSVVDAGQPRSVRYINSVYQLTASQIDVTAGQKVLLDSARWTLATVTGDNVTILRNAVFGRPDATPVVGDWNGDGTTKIGVFVDGQWYLDLNGDGRWDQGDLWAKLGTRDDLPVTGDWDGDGKTDIGIYGPAWARDPWAIANEPGIPDADNWPTWLPGKMKNMPPTADEATSGGRVMKRTGDAKSRTDVIDHVFYYGAPGDAPLAGDWNGDGIRTIGTFRDGHWILDTDGDGRLTDKDASFEFGKKGDLPIVGDFDGDGVDEIGIYRDGKWIIDINHNHQIDAQDMVFELGGYGDKPVVGDWNGDGVDDPGTYQPSVAQDRVSRRAS